MTQPTEGTCRHCDGPIVFKPYYLDGKLPNPPVWWHETRPGVGSSTCSSNPTRVKSWPCAEPVEEQPTAAPRFGFEVRFVPDLDGDTPSGWEVRLPHQCDVWRIDADSYQNKPSRHADALAALDRFIVEAQHARDSLAAGHHHPLPARTGGVLTDGFRPVGEGPVCDMPAIPARTDRPDVRIHPNVGPEALQAFLQGLKHGVPTTTAPEDAPSTFEPEPPRPVASAGFGVFRLLNEALRWEGGRGADGIFLLERHYGPASAAIEVRMLCDVCGGDWLDSWIVGQENILSVAEQIRGDAHQHTHTTKAGEQP